jgi:hypothetical protein
MLESPSLRLRSRKMKIRPKGGAAGLALHVQLHIPRYRREASIRSSVGQHLPRWKYQYLLTNLSESGTC